MEWIQITQYWFSKYEQQITSHTIKALEEIRVQKWNQNGNHFPLILKYLPLPFPILLSQAVPLSCYRLCHLPGRGCALLRMDSSVPRTLTCPLFPKESKSHLTQMTDRSIRPTQIAFSYDPQRKHFTNRSTVPLLFEPAVDQHWELVEEVAQRKKTYEGKKSSCL